MDLQSIEDDPPQSRELAVNHKSALMDIKTSELCSGALLSEVMHDLLEGVLQYETKLLLEHCLQNFTLDTLNCTWSNHMALNLIDYHQLPLKYWQSQVADSISKVNMNACIYPLHIENDK